MLTYRSEVLSLSALKHSLRPCHSPALFICSSFHRCKEEARRACRAGKKQLVGSLLLQPRRGIPSCQGQGPAVQRTASLGFRRQHLQVALAPQLTLYREKAWMFLWLWFELGCPASALWPTMSHPDLFPYPPGTEVSQGQAEDRETH